MRRNRIKFCFLAPAAALRRGEQASRIARGQLEFCDALQRIMGWSEHETPQQVRAMRRAASFVLSKLTG